MSLLIFFQNGRILLVKRYLALHFIGSVNALDSTAGANNRMHYIGSVNELDVGV